MAMDIRSATAQPASLRRADWRFLLPSPPGGAFQHLVLLGGSSDLAARIVEVGLADRVSSELPRDRSADALVVLHDAGVALNAAVTCLLSGGVLYCEIDRRSVSALSTTPHRVRRSLHDIGLSTTGVYWAAPDFDRCKRYLPLDVAVALRWYLGTLYTAGTMSLRLLEIALHIYTGLRIHRFAPLVPCLAVTAVAGSDQCSAPSVLGHPKIPMELRQPGLRPVVLTSGQDDASRVVMLPFVPSGTSPTAVLKISRLAAFNANTEREQITLSELRTHLDASMRRTIPQPLGTFRYGDLIVGVESCAPGHSLWTSSGRWRASVRQQIDDLHLASRWLGEFHRQALVARVPWDDAAIERWVETPFSAYTCTFGLTPDEEQLLVAIRRHARVLVGAHLPIVWLHHDFGPWNLYRADRELTVVDWEFGRDWQRDRYGPALCDLLYFVTYWNHAVRHLNDQAAEMRGFYQLFVAPNEGDDRLQSVHRAIAEYMTALDIDRGFLLPLLVYTWIEQALHQLARKRALGNGSMDARQGIGCIHYIAVLAGHIEQLFPGISAE
jgi:hypothetical protein